MMTKHVWYLCREDDLLPARGGKTPQAPTLIVHLHERHKPGDDAKSIAWCGRSVTLLSLPSPIAGGAMLACVACLGLSENPKITAVAPSEVPK